MPDLCKKKTYLNKVFCCAFVSIMSLYEHNPRIKILKPFVWNKTNMCGESEKSTVLFSSPSNVWLLAVLRIQREAGKLKPLLIHLGDTFSVWRTPECNSFFISWATSMQAASPAMASLQGFNPQNILQH